MEVDHYAKKYIEHLNKTTETIYFDNIETFKKHINAQDQFGKTILHYYLNNYCSVKNSTLLGDPLLIKFLIDMGSDCTLEDNDGKTAYDCLIWKAIIFKSNKIAKEKIIKAYQYMKLPLPNILTNSSSLDPHMSTNSDVDIDGLLIKSSLC